MLVSTYYAKDKGQRSYKRVAQNKSKNGSIREYLGLFPTKDKQKPYNIVKTKYSNFGRTFTRIVKNKNTGNSYMLVLKEKY